jgi:hypothetical protein
MATIAATAGEKAELDIDLSVEPPLVEVAVPPGGRRAVGIKVRNNDTREVHIHSEITAARMEPNGMFTYPGDSRKKAPGWLAVSSDDLRLAPKRSTTIRAQVSVPAEGMAHMPLVAVVRLQASVPEETHGGDWSVGGEFPVVIVVQDPHVSQAELEIVSFTVVRSTPEHNPAAAVLRVRNGGTKVAKIKGSILLQRESGLEIARKRIGVSQPELILSGSEREFRMPLGPLDEGTFSVRAKLDVPGSSDTEKTAQLTFESTSAKATEIR